MKALNRRELAEENARLRERLAEVDDGAGFAAREEFADAPLFDAERRRYRILTESSFDIVCEIDASSRFRYLSPNYRDVLGWDPEAMVDTDVFDVVHPDERSAAGEQIERSFVTGWGKLNLRVRHNDGQWRWFECIGRRFESADGDHRVLVISRDVSDRVHTEQQLIEAHDELDTRVRQRTKELAEANAQLITEISERETAEQQLRSSEERLRRVVENAPDVVLTLDGDGRIMFINTPMKSAGVDSSAIGTSAYDYVSPEHRHRMRNTIERVFATGQPAEYEAQDLENRDWFRTRVGPVVSHGKVNAVVLICSNVTAQKKAEHEMRQSQVVLERRVIERTQQLAAANEQLRLDILRREETERQLRESEERFRAMAEANPVPVFISRYSDGRFLYVNDRLLEMLGIKREKLLTQSTTAFYSRPEDRTQLMRALSREGQVRDYELKAKWPDGSPMWLWVSNRRIAYQGESAVLTSFLDITARKLDEDRLRHERTVLKQMLDLQDRERQLTAYEIHDGMVQDMTGALLYLEAARGAKSNRERMQNLNLSLALLQGAIGEARRLINGLRPPILDEEGVVPAIEHLAADMRNLVGLRVRIKHDISTPRFSPARENTIYRVVQEALTNVHRHSGAKSATVELVEADGWLRVAVRDRGAGFDPGNIPPSRFGLAGIKERARLFGGTATVRSKPGKGTTVIVEIPVGEGVDADDET
ncbi:MAG: PAS domain S-box protein [Pirellulales bacterium]